jgi:hypothetical protein
MDERMGTNINGPSLIRVPGFVAQPLGKYYLYFAHHKGSYIRLAYADNVEGPYTVYTPGALQLSESHFDIERPTVDSVPEYSKAYVEHLIINSPEGPAAVDPHIDLIPKLM